MLYNYHKLNRTAIASGDGWRLTQDPDTLRITARGPNGEVYHLINVKTPLTKENMNLLFMCIERDAYNTGRPYPVLRNQHNYRTLLALYLGDEGRKAKEAKKKAFCSC